MLFELLNAKDILPHVQQTVIIVALAPPVWVIPLALTGTWTASPAL